MTLMQILWPWGEMRRLRLRAAYLERQEQGMQELLRQTREYHARMDNQHRVEMDRARAMLNQAHFRDPRTGRLLRKGVIPF